MYTSGSDYTRLEIIYIIKKLIHNSLIKSSIYKGKKGNVWVLQYIVHNT